MYLFPSSLRLHVIYYVCRLSPSYQVQRMMTLWDSLQAAQVIEEFGRNEVEATSNKVAPKQDVLAALFEDAPRQVRRTDDAASSQGKKEAERE